MKEAAHLVRLALILIGIAGIFAIARQGVIPAGFGQYGHFRAGALSDNRSGTLAYAGRAACEVCHEDAVKVLKASRHGGIGCEACHGPQFDHAQAEDPAARKPAAPDAVVLCARCHEQNSARPEFLPQVKTQEHSGGETCKSCHQPHSPKVGG